MGSYGILANKIAHLESTLVGLQGAAARAEVVQGIVRAAWRLYKAAESERDCLYRLVELEELGKTHDKAMEDEPWN